MVGKHKKKGRPSLLDLHKRSLRSPQNPNSTNHSHNENQHRRHTRRNPLPLATPPETNHLSDDDEDDEDEDESDGRREKKLKLVLKLQHNEDDDDVSDHRGSRRIRDADQQKTHNSASKATDVIREIPSDSGPTTPLPDKKLLLFILDKLQKKDTYGVFSEPVDPEELPDYHDVIKHPMDFATVRKKLDSGAYQNLEQFEKDVFLISFNAMTYNAPDTVYHRQARAIQELAKKNFEELRHESDDEPDIKVVRRGRPSLKTLMKKTPGRPAERAVSDLSSVAILANSRDTGQWANMGNDASKKGHTPDKPETAEPVMRSSYALRETRTYSWTSEHKFDEEITASLLKGGSGKYGTKATVIGENRRNTYKQPLPSTFVCEPPILNTFEGERKQLVPVGLYMEHAYARSLARFAANLGPVGWEIATQRIQKSLPPGTKFGRGWVGDSEAPQKYQLPLLVSSPPDHSQSKSLPTFSGTVDNKPPDRQEPSSSHQAAEEGDSIRNLSPVNASQTRNSDAKCIEGRFNLSSPTGSVRPKTPFQVPQNATPPTLNGLNHHAFAFDSSAHAAKMSMMRQMRPPGNFNVDPHMSNAAMLNMASRGNSFVHQVPRNQVEVERARLAGQLMDSSNNNISHESASDSQGPWQLRSQNSNTKHVSAAPDLNVSFQSPSSPASKQPDLALQL